MDRLILALLLAFAGTGVGAAAVEPAEVALARQDVVDEVAAFLGEYYRGFELADLNRMDAGMSADFTATMLIPSRGDAPMHYDRAALLEGLRQAFEYYAGKRPRMEIRDVRVLPRSRDEAVAFFAMHFHQDGRFVDAALSIADLRREDGRWKLYRLYENKRR